MYFLTCKEMSIAEATHLYSSDIVLRSEFSISLGLGAKVPEKPVWGTLG